MEINSDLFFECLIRDCYLQKELFAADFNSDHVKTFSEWLALFLHTIEYRNEAQSSLESKYKKAYLISEVNLE